MNKLLFFFIVLGLFSCGNATETPDTPTETVETVPAPTKTPAAKADPFDMLKEELSTKPKDFDPASMLPSIEVSVLENLWENCTFVDYVYYQLPISASLDNQNAIRSAISHIAENPAGKIAGCKPLGRVFYQTDGEVALQGDIFFTKGCTYFLWADTKGKYYAANMMTDTGFKFFANNIKAASGSIPDAQ